MIVTIYHNKTIKSTFSTVIFFKYRSIFFISAVVDIWYKETYCLDTSGRLVSQTKGLIAHVIKLYMYTVKLQQLGKLHRIEALQLTVSYL